MDALPVDGDTATRHLVAVPYPGRGHVNPMMNLCRLLLLHSGSSDRRLIITFVVTEEWLGFLGSTPMPPGIRFRSIPNVIPSELNRGADFIAFVEAVYTKLESPFELLLDQLEPNVVVNGIVADTFLPWAVAVGNRRNIPVYSLFTMSASVFSVLLHFDLLAANGHVAADLSDKGEDKTLDYVPGIKSLRLSDFHYLFSAQKPHKRLLEAISWVSKAQGLLFTSFYELESHVIDKLRAELPFPVYPIGPSIPHMMLQEKPTRSTVDTEYYNWLDSQPKNSVLYISLGSFLSVSGGQMDEIAMGLRASGVRFIWVARQESRRLLEISGEMGLVVPWCDQLRVLCHPSVGGFLTHCGWNSTLEAVFAGKPMLTFPLFADQLCDSRFIADEWKVGFRVKSSEVGKDHKDDGIVGGEEIAGVVKKLMDMDGEESKEVRRRAGEFSESCRAAVEEGGSSFVNLNAFVRDLVHGHGC